jgi:hypothetical protein
MEESTMKRYVIALLVCVGIALSSVQAQAQAAQSTPARLAALEAQVTQLQTQINGIGNPAVPLGITVNCGTPGQTVAGALAKAALYTGPVEIVINGVCAEAVELTRSNTSLRGGSQGGGLNPVSGTALAVTAALNVRIYDLTLTGTQMGLALRDAAHVVLYSSSVVGNGKHGIFLESSTLSLRAGNTVSHNGGSGILARQSRLSVDGSEIAQNGAAGIDLTDGSSALVQATHIADNSGEGIALYFSSTLNLQSGCVIERNLGGVSATGASSMVLGTGVTIQSNLSDGVFLADVSVAAAFGEPLIQNNAGWGVSCAASPAVAQLVTRAFGTVIGNVVGQVNCRIP